MNVTAVSSVPVTVLDVCEDEFMTWLNHYLSRGYRCRLLERAAECRKRINEVMDHTIVIRVVGGGS